MRGWPGWNRARTRTRLSVTADHPRPRRYSRSPRTSKESRRFRNGMPSSDTLIGFWLIDTGTSVMRMGPTLRLRAIALAL